MTCPCAQLLSLSLAVREKKKKVPERQTKWSCILTSSICCASAYWLISRLFFPTQSIQLDEFLNLAFLIIAKLFRSDGLFGSGLYVILRVSISLPEPCLLALSLVLATIMSVAEDFLVVLPVVHFICLGVPILHNIIILLISKRIINEG